MSTYNEIYNYLNLVDRNLGRLYKKTGFNPLPADFKFDKETIKERLYLNQMASVLSFPDFLYEEKKLLKKRFSGTLKLIRTILKEEKYKNYMSPEFARKFEVYMVMRREVTSLILKSFSKESFDECDAYTEICHLNTIFFDLLEGFFDDGFNFLDILPDLEKNYNLYYGERLKLIEKKNNEKIERNTIENSLKITKNNVKTNKNNLKLQKIDLKYEKQQEKIKKSKELSNFKSKIESRSK